MGLRWPQVMWGLCLVGGVWTAHASSPPTLPAWEDLTAVEAEAGLLPALGARAEAARARLRWVEGALEGQATWQDAIPEVVDPTDPVALRARLATLDRRGVARANEATARWPEGWSSTLTRRADRARAEALEAEARLDEGERRLLHRQLAVLERWPRWQADGIDLGRAPLEQARRVEIDRGEEASMERVARLDEARRRWTELVRRAQRMVRTGGTLEVSEELGALSEDAVLARDAIARLDAVRPALSLVQRAEVDEAIAAWWQGQGAGVSPGVSEDLPLGESERLAALAEAEAHFARAEAALSAEPWPPDAAEARIEAERQGAQAQAERWRRRVEQLRDLDRKESARRADREASQRAVEAAARASEIEHGALSQIEQDSLRWTAAAWDVVARWRGLWEDEEEQRRRALDEVRSRIEVLVADREGMRWAARSREADALYAGLREQMTAVRRLLLDAPPEPSSLLLEAGPPPDGDRAAILQAEAGRGSGLASVREQAEVAASVARVRATLAAEAEPEAELHGALADLIAHRVEALREIKALRHQLRRLVGQPSTEADLGAFVLDLRDEVRLLPLQAGVYLGERWERLRETGAVLLDGRRLFRAIADLLWTGVALGIWLVLRSRAPALSDRLASLAPMASRRVKVREEMTQAWRPVLVSCLDALAAGFVAWSAGSHFQEGQVLLRALAWWGVWRALLGAVGLLVSTPAEQRRSPFFASEEGLRVLRWGLWWLGGWWVIRYVVLQSLTELLYADVLASVVRMVLAAAGVLLVAIVLGVWAPRLRRRVEPMKGNPPWVRPWLQQRSKWVSAVLAPLTALALLLYLLGAAVWDVLQRRATRQDTARSVLAWVDRWRRRDEQDEKDPVRTPIDDALRDALRGEPPGPGAVLPREEAGKAFLDHVSSWHEERRRGVLAVTGDKGDGKKLFLDGVLDQVATTGLEVVRIMPEARLASEEALHAWLAEALGLDQVPSDAQAWYDVLVAWDPKVFVIRHAERAFLRQVHGFGALRALLDIMNRTGDHHLWVLSMHRPAWSYLSRLGPLMNLGVVRGVVDIKPLKPDRVRELIMRRMQVLETEVSFTALEETGPFGAPPHIEHKRAQETYFRLLTDASGGNARIALHLWAASLRRGRSGTVEVFVPQDFSNAPPEGLRSEDLFVLAALRIQESLTLGELEAQAVREDDDVQAIVRALEQRGLVHIRDGVVSLDSQHVVSITRLLRRRHFLQWVV